MTEACAGQATIVISAHKVGLCIHADKGIKGPEHVVSTHQAAQGIAS